MYFKCYKCRSIKRSNELEDLCDLAVRGLDEIIDHQKYPVEGLQRYQLKQEEV